VLHINQDILISIGAELRARREAMSFSQNDIANMTGLTVNTVSALEKGKGSTLNNFLLICRALKIQPKDVFTNDIDLTPLYTLPPSTKRRVDITKKLDELVNHSDFFHTPKRVAEVIEKLESDKSESNKFSVYLTGYCKEGELEYIKEGNIKRYVKKK
jgi:transcriptional regulator with XRE-family HTH domain